MLTRILVILALITFGCESNENTLDLSGEWMDTSCIGNLENCESRYPIISINPKIPDSIFVKKQDGKMGTLWAYSRWQSISITLENGRETLIFPNYKTKNLQYYDNITKKFVYYSKLRNN